jgi:GNAT superfamily N-acetyltransferase
LLCARTLGDRPHPTCKKIDVAIRPLEKKDIPAIAWAFQQLGWNKPASQYERYLREQELGTRLVLVAFVKEEFAGYLTICWDANYEPFRARKIPKIVDFNVLPPLRRQGIGTQLMHQAEHEIAKVSTIAGIGVGMHREYGAAQRLYVLRGYVPDGQGLYHIDHHVGYGETITVDDHLALYLTRKLK